jgi:hypothetical protein
VCLIPLLYVTIEALGKKQVVSPTNTESDEK